MGDDPLPQRPSTKIPNVYHFICLQPMEFNLVHALAITTCQFINQPRKITVYVDQEPKNNTYWDKIKKFITVEKVVRPELVDGVQIVYPQLMADLLRLEILIENGGVYLDFDTLVLRSMEKLLHHDAVVFSNLDDDDPEDLGKITTISNGFLGFQANDPFLKEWRGRILEHLGDEGVWAWGAVVLPAEIYKENRGKWNYLEIKNFDDYSPFDWNNAGPAFDDQYRGELYENAYSIHLWQSLLHDEVIVYLNEQYFLSYDNWFTRRFREYFEILRDMDP